MREPREYEAPACAEVGGDFWFPEKDKGSISQTEIQFAKSICKSCPHQSECAEWGIVNETHGIWGGLVSRERYKIRSQRGITIKERDIA